MQWAPLSGLPHGVQSVALNSSESNLKNQQDLSQKCSACKVRLETFNKGDRVKWWGVVESCVGGSIPQPYRNIYIKS